MLSNGKSYAVLRSFDLLRDPSRTEENFELFKENAYENIRKAYYLYAAIYKLRSLLISYHVAQTIFRRNFSQHRLLGYYNTKLANQFQKGVVIARHN